MSYTFPYNVDYYPRMVFEHFDRKDLAFQPLPFLLHDVHLFGDRASKPTESIVRIDVNAETTTGGGLEGFNERKVSDTGTLVIVEFCRMGAADDIDLLIIGMINSCQYPSEGAWFEKGTNVNTVRAVSATGSGKEATDNITCAIGTFHKYEVKIKNGHVYFKIDGVEVAHHTSKVPYTSRLYSNLIAISKGSKDIFLEIDYFHEILGTSF